MSADATPLDGALHPIDERMRTVWAVGAVIPWAVLALAGATVALVAGAPDLAGAVALLGVLAALGCAAWAAAAWRRWRWAAWDDALELRHGVVVARSSLVPYARIQQIDVERGPLERALGLSRLVLRTAAATTDAELPGIPDDQVDALRRHLLARAGLDDAV